MSGVPPMEGLTPVQRRELLARLLRERQQRQMRRTAPLSCPQQRLWVLEQMGSAGTAYNIVAYMQIDGSLQDEALRRALDAVVRRHETLRTTFDNEAGK